MFFSGRYNKHICCTGFAPVLLLLLLLLLLSCMFAVRDVQDVSSMQWVGETTAALLLAATRCDSQLR
jgi:hypothetical protein